MKSMNAYAPVKAPWAVPKREPKPQVEGKFINDPADIEFWLSSQLCQELLSFVVCLGDSVVGRACNKERLPKASAPVQSLVELLHELGSWIDEFPPLNQPMRFGNRAFKSWHGRLVERADGLLLKAIEQASDSVGTSEQQAALAKEVKPYLVGAFGDPTRIDYGTGHEVSFIALLFALSQRNVLTGADNQDLVLCVFVEYMAVMRRLQTVYLLEPAGSHGVWGLDDFHCLPFLFGAAQLVDQEEEIPVDSIAKDYTQKEFRDSYLYIDAIGEILRVKKGVPFHESSPMLYNITAVPTWQKVYQGLQRMFKAEVLGKFPVIQHFHFGEILRWPQDKRNQ